MVQSPLILFSECAKHTTDPYWIGVFEDLSKKRFPKGFGYSPKDEYTVFFRNKTTKYLNLKEYPIPELTSILKTHLKTLGLQSQQDELENKGEWEEWSRGIESCINVENWKEIRKKNLKDMLIRNFILTLKEMYGWNHEQTQRNYQFLKLAFLFHWISSNDIQYSDGQIDSIDGLVIKNNEFELKVTGSKEDKREYSTLKFIPSTLYKNYVNSL